MGKQDFKVVGSRGCAARRSSSFGALPASGAEIPTFLSTVTEKKLSKHPEEFGHGAIEGVAGPEASNNASAAGTLVPMLALGLPVSATAAVMLAAFPDLRHPTRAAAVRAGGPAGVGPDRQPVHRQRAAAGAQPAAGPIRLAAGDPRPYLYAGILFFATLGAYSANAQVFDLVCAAGVGRVGVRDAPLRAALSSRRSSA